MLPLIGAHVATAGGLATVPSRAKAIGAEVVQIFNSNARMWRVQPRTDEELQVLTTGLQRLHAPLFLHSIYLINLAGPDSELRRRSAEALSAALVLGSITGAQGIVTHIGSRHQQSFEAAARFIVGSVLQAHQLAKQALAELTTAGQGLPPLLLETGSGSGTTVGGRLEELAALVPALPQPCGICLDSAHLFAAGYPIHTQRGLSETMTLLEGLDLLRHVRLFHLNDSKATFASKRDRHENLGEGEIGREGLSRIVRHAAFRHVPFVLEVPGIAGKGPDSADVAYAKSLRDP